MLQTRSPIVSPVKKVQMINNTTIDFTVCASHEIRTKNGLGEQGHGVNSCSVRLYRSTSHTVPRSDPHLIGRGKSEWFRKQRQFIESSSPVPLPDLLFDSFSYPVV